jgi:hypothetical protein
MTKGTGGAEERKKERKKARSMQRERKNVIPYGV